MSDASDADIVSLFAIQLATTIGPDHWNRSRPQPITLSLHLHLAPSYLDTPGRSDNVTDSLHYGHLAKVVAKRVGTKGERSYASARDLLDDVTDAAFRFALDATQTAEHRAGGVVHAVRAVVHLPKQILLAAGFAVELTTRAADWTTRALGGNVARPPAAIVRVTELTLAVLVGVNPPERLAKQRVVTDLTFFEAAGVAVVDYPAIIQRVATGIEHSAHLTLEKLVYEIIQTAYRASDVYSDAHVSRFDAITVRCQKPSALSFADASGVEMTRTLEALRRVGK